MAHLPTLSAYCLMAARAAGSTIGSFDNNAAAQMFYDIEHGPLPLARKLFADQRLRSAFVGGFMDAFKTRGFTIVSSAPCTILAAGFIVTDNEAIHGFGATAQLAHDDFLANMTSAGITLLGEDDDSGDQQGSWARACDFQTRAASAALLAQVDEEGGGCGWRMLAGVACTIAEVTGGEGEVF